MSIKIPIQINGGVSKPIDGQLLDRELYISSDGKLYFGEGGTTPRTRQVIPEGVTTYLGSSDNDIHITSNNDGSSEMVFRYPSEEKDSYVGKNEYKDGDAPIGENVDVYKKLSGLTECYNKYGTKLYNFHLTESGITRSNLYESSVNDCVLNGTRGIQLDKYNPTTGEGCYGYTLPETGSNGQLFFLIISK